MTLDEWSKVNGSWNDNPDGAGSGGSRPRFDWMGLDRDRSGLADGDADREGSPNVPGFGMTPTQLYLYQREFTEQSSLRLLDVGAAQYDAGSFQKFESMPVHALVGMLREELMDVVNYATMLDILIRRWGETFKAASHG